MDNWKSIVIRPVTSVHDAISALDKGGARIALVADGNGRLVGTITDGDVRRGLLNGVSLEEPCSSIMSSSPVSAKATATNAEIEYLFSKHQIMHVPLVDDDGRLAGVKMLQDGSQAVSLLENPVFLMAGGFGTRLKPLTDNCPKPLLKVGSKPILELILESFVRYGFYRFYISTHYMPEAIKAHFGDGSRWGVSIRYVQEDDPLGTGGALGLLPVEEIQQPLIMMNGDLLTNVNFKELLEFHRGHKSVATICVRDYEYQVPFGVIETDGINVVSMDEKPTKRHLVNAGIYVLDSSVVKSVKPGQKIDMPTLLQQHKQSGNNLATFPVHEYWLDIGRKEDFLKAQADVATMLND